MNFQFNVKVTFDQKSIMFSAYPELYNKKGIARLDIIVDVRNFVKYRPAPYVQNSFDQRFYDEGDDFEADVRMFAKVNDTRIELPDIVVVETGLLDKVERIGEKMIDEHNEDIETELYLKYVN